MTSKTSQKMMQRRLKKLHILTPKKMPFGGGGIKKSDEKIGKNKFRRKFYEKKSIKSK